MPDAAAPPPPPPGVEHLQRMAHEALQAARALIDAAEEIIGDPEALGAVVQTVAAVAKNATETIAGFAAGAGLGGASTAAPPAETGDTEDDGGFERIRLD